MLFHIKKNFLNNATINKKYDLEQRKFSIRIVRPQLPPTSVMIQSGIAILIMAQISANRNNTPEMIVNLSIFALLGTGYDWGVDTLHR